MSITNNVKKKTKKQNSSTNGESVPQHPNSQTNRVKCQGMASFSDLNGSLIYILFEQQGQKDNELMGFCSMSTIDYGTEIFSGETMD